ncbi:MAG: helix-turn-helix transcriptional regulator [Quadrisphaera sp.]
MEADTPSRRVAAEMRRRLVVADLSIRQVARRSKTPAPSLYRYFQGTRPWPLDTLHAVCDVLGVQPSEVIAETSSATAAAAS